MVWYGMVWYGVVWYGMVWYGMVWCGVVWCGMVWYGMVWYGMIWCGMVWYGMVWYGMVYQGEGSGNCRCGTAVRGRPGVPRGHDVVLAVAEAGGRGRGEEAPRGLGVHPGQAERCRGDGGGERKIRAGE